MPFPSKTNSDAIIASASDIIRSDGLAALSMRTLAGRLGVRASSLYRHFPDRSAIERMLAVRAGEQLLDRMRQAASEQQGESALHAAARAYLEFAMGEAAFYDVMMQSLMLKNLMLVQETSSPVVRQLWDFFLKAIGSATGAEEDPSAAAALWSYLHGYSFLVRAGQFGDLPPAPAFTRGTQALLRGLSVRDAEAAGRSV